MTEKFNPSKYTAHDTFGELASTHGNAFERVPAQVLSVEWVAARLPGGAKVLDVGCGSGCPACEILVNAGLDVTGIDITADMIAIAKSKVPGAKYELSTRVRGSRRGEEGSLDAIVSIFAFSAAVSQSDIRNFFHRAHNWLRPGGCWHRARVRREYRHQVAVKECRGFQSELGGHRQTD